MILELTVPYPPSVNHYWRMHQGRMLISRKGRQYRGMVKFDVMAQIRQTGRAWQQGLTGRLHLEATAFMPDRRKRDLDNLCKSLLDSLQHAGVYHDDSQIDDLHIIRGPVRPPGKIEIDLIEVD